MIAYKHVSQGYILPVLLSMKTRITQIEDSNNVIKDFKRVILNIINDRFGKYFDYSLANKDFILSATTLPRFKTNFILSEQNKCHAKTLLIAECKILSGNHSDISTNVEQDLPIPTENDDFFVFHHTSQNVRRDSIDNQIESEVSQFLLDPRKENKILNEYRNVRTVFYKYNTTLSSSAPVERVFSQSLMIFTARRSRLSADNFEKTIILKHNRSLIGKPCKN